MQLTSVLLILVLGSPAWAAKSYVLDQPGIYIGKDDFGGRHCFVQVRKWTPKKIVVRTRTRSSDWSNDFGLFATPDEDSRTVYMSNPTSFSKKTVGIRFSGQQKVVATIKANEHRSLCRDLRLAQ